MVSANIYSVMEMAKANNLNLFYYLTYLLEKLSNAVSGNLEELN